MRQLFIEAFSSFVPNIKSFGLHSLRAGGATAACNFGISDRLFKRHGRWKSETAKDGYVKESVSDRILVSLNLNLYDIPFPLNLFQFFFPFFGSAAALSCDFSPYKSFVSLLFQFIHYISYNIIRITFLLLNTHIICGIRYMRHQVIGLSTRDSRMKVMTRERHLLNRSLHLVSFNAAHLVDRLQTWQALLPQEYVQRRAKGIRSLLYFYYIFHIKPHFSKHYYKVNFCSIFMKLLPTKGRTSVVFCFYFIHLFEAQIFEY